jgi:hypothetical protein
VTWEDVARAGLVLPEVEEATSYGTPALRLRGRLLVRLHDDGETLALRVDPEERLALVHEQPEIFYVTPHYQDYPFVLVRLAAVDREELEELLAEAWLLSAPKRLAAAHPEVAG